MRTQQDMLPRWEYKHQHITLCNCSSWSCDCGSIQEQLNWLGEEGWELVAVLADGYHYFKRQLT